MAELVGEQEEVPLFPLKVVLFPGGRLPLRIFEARYIDMIGRCMRNDEAFGVIGIQEGAEVGGATPFTVGCLARIVDWGQGEDGLLHIVAQGDQRFRLHDTRSQEDGLMVGRVERIPAEPVMPVPEEYRTLAEILGELMDREIGGPPAGERSPEDASWVSMRLAERLPIGLAQLQFFLEISDPIRRLDILRTLVQALAAEARAQEDDDEA